MYILKVLVLHAMLLVVCSVARVSSSSENDADPEMEMLITKLNELRESTDAYDHKLNIMKEDLTRLRHKAMECEKKLVFSCDDGRTSRKDVKRNPQQHGNSGTVINRGTIKDDCSCEQCEIEMNKLIGKISHYLRELDDCETNKRNHQILRYFLRKELAKCKERIAHGKKEIGSVDVAISETEGIARKYRTELNRLGREHLALLKEHEVKKTQKERMEEQLETCLIEKQNARLDHVKSDEAFRKKEVALVTLEEKHESANKITAKYLRKTETCREYLKPCLCAIGTVCLTEAFLWLRKSKNIEITADGQIVGGKKQKRKHKQRQN